MARSGAALQATPDEVTSAFAEDGRILAAALGARAMTRTLGHASLMITGVPIPTLNGVVTLRPSVKAADAGKLLEVMERKHIPHSIQIRPGCGSELAELAASRGLVEDEPVPLMVMQPAADRLGEVARHPDLSIRVLAPDEASVHVAIGAEGFGAPVELFEALVTPRVLAHPAFRAYVGTVEGEPVTTALGLVHGDHVGIFDVATPPRHRGRGYGAAVTARAALDGFEAGASFAYLQSSPAGFGIYERLGFRTLETWTVWVTPGAPSHS